MFYLFWEYNLILFLFWWWVSWKIDLRNASRDCGRAWTIAEFIFGLTLSLVLLLQSGNQNPRGPYPQAVEWVRMGWALSSCAIPCCASGGHGQCGVEPQVLRPDYPATPHSGSLSKKRHSLIRVWGVQSSLPNIRVDRTAAKLHAWIGS